MTPPSPPIRIFLVDDYKTVLWGLGKLINGEYPRMQLVGTARNRSEALAGVRWHRPHVVLLDNNLGSAQDKGGILSFLPRLVALGDHRVLLLTNHSCPPEQTRQAIALGASGTLGKDAPASLLLHAIEYVHCHGCWPERLPH